MRSPNAPGSHCVDSSPLGTLALPADRKPTTGLAYLTATSSTPCVPLNDHADSATDPHHDWASRFAQQYHLRLDASLIDWLDSQQWQTQGSGEFRLAATPEDWLADCPESIWPGLMPPDVLPILGNEYGDWLCLRIGSESRVSEVIHWYHGGGDWIPWGRTLPEAIAFQQIRDHLPGHAFRHADAAERVRRSHPEDPHFVWAKAFLPATAVQLIESLPARDPAAGQDALGILESLIATDVATVPLHAEAILRALDTPLRRLTPAMIAPLGVDWESQAMGWMFDADLVPDLHRPALAQILPEDSRRWRQQDWQTAQRHAQAVVHTRSDLGWALLTLGWIAEKQRDFPTALRFYSHALPASVLADQSVRFRTHGNEEDKFSARRLANLLKRHPPLSVQINADYWQVWSAAPSGQRADAIAEFWRLQSQRAIEAGDWSSAYEARVRQGWDLGLKSIQQYGGLLTDIAAAAKHAGQAGRAAVASAHARCFQQRFA